MTDPHIPMRSPLSKSLLRSGDGMVGVGRGRGLWPSCQLAETIPRGFGRDTFEEGKRQCKAGLTAACCDRIQQG